MGQVLVESEFLVSDADWASNCAIQISKEHTELFLYEWGSANWFNRTEPRNRTGGIAPFSRTQISTQHRVDINTNSLIALESIPRIRMEEAKAILEYRKVNGDFSDCRDLFKLRNEKENIKSSFIKKRESFEKHLNRPTSKYK